MLITPFVSLFGAVFYFLCAKYLILDKEAAGHGTKETTDNEDSNDLNSLPPRRGSNESLSDNINDEDTNQLIPNYKINHGGPSRKTDFDNQI